jgi:hypothetical protein
MSEKQGHLIKNHRPMDEKDPSLDENHRRMEDEDPSFAKFISAPEQCAG